MSALKREARRRAVLADEVRGQLPAEEAAHVVGAHVDADGAIVVAVDSAAWASRLRFADFKGRTVRVRVAPPGDGGA